MSDAPDDTPPAPVAVSATELVERELVELLAKSAIVHHSRAQFPSSATSDVSAGIAWPTWSPYPFAIVKWSLCGVPLEAWEPVTDWPAESTEEGVTRAIVGAAINKAVERLTRIVHERLMAGYAPPPAEPA